MTRMTHEEQLALKWALEQDSNQGPQPRGTQAALILAKYIERNALEVTNTNNLSPSVQADLDRLQGDSRVIVADPGSTVRDVKQTIIK